MKLTKEQVEEIKCSHLAGADNSKQKRLAIRQHIEQLFFEYIREEEDSSNSDCEEANATFQSLYILEGIPFYRHSGSRARGGELW